MQWTSALAIYFLIWFLCLFLILPFHGRRTEQGEGEASRRGDQGEAQVAAGHDPGAPHHFPVWRVVGQVTVLALIVFGTYYAIYVSGLVTRASLNWLPAPPDR